MANNCMNDLYVSGNKKDIKRFLKKGIKDETWALSHYVPCPEPLLRTICPNELAIGKKLVNGWEVKWAENKIKAGEKNVVIPEPIKCSNNTILKQKRLKAKYGVNNWNDWRCNAYGTKWDCATGKGTYNDYQTDGETYFNTSFDSAWSPPVNWLMTVQAMFPKLKFKLLYMETGCWFAGIAYTNEEMDGTICDNTGEPECQDEGGMVYTHDSDEGVYVGTDGTKIPEDDWFDGDNTEVNPFENEKMWWE